MICGNFGRPRSTNPEQEITLDYVANIDRYVPGIW